MLGKRVLQLFVAVLIVARPARAEQWVFLDFTAFNLSDYETVNGHTPPTANDVAAIKAQILVNMVRDYAPFDVHFTTFAPETGRFTRVAILHDKDLSGLFGCAGGTCCKHENCTGIGSFTNMVSGCEIYAGSFGRLTSFKGANATTARIANAISGTASHELGHVLGLSHCNAADDFVSSGSNCFDGFGGTSDRNVNFHIMASGASSGLTDADRATRDRFFSVHSERRVLFKGVQVRNHWSLLKNLSSSGSTADLLYGEVTSPTTVLWRERSSTGSAFGSLSTWAADAGDAGDIFLEGDVDGDGRADLVVGHIVSASSVRWTVFRSLGTTLAAPLLFSASAGAPGNIFRLADIDGDGRKDLLRGIVLSSTDINWVMHRSNATSFGASALLSRHAGAASDLFLTGDMTADGRDDLMVVGRGALTRTEVHKSTATSLTSAGTDAHVGFDPDYVLLGDLDNDGSTDLVTGRVVGDFRVDWDVRRSNACTGPLGNCLNSVIAGYKENAGDAGDQFRLGDGNGGGKQDLFYARMVGETSRINPPDLSLITWFGRLSQFGTFQDDSVWIDDAGDEGFIFP